MIYASDLGLKVGSKIKVIGDGVGCCFNDGDIIELVEDDGQTNPFFRGGSPNRKAFSLDRYKWEHYKEEEKGMTSVTKIKFPCCVPMSDIKDQDTFDKVFALFIASGADAYDVDWEDNMEYGYKYFGVDYDKDTVFYSQVESYSWNDVESEVTAYSVAKLLGLVAKEEPVAEVPPLLTLFTIGTEVKIAKESKYYVESDLHNPVNTRGVLIGNKPNYRDDEYIYRVRWENGTTNCYEIHDLVLWEDDVSVASQEAITERLEDNPSVGIDYSVMGTTASTEPLITITQEVKYTVVIKGTTFTFTQEELDTLTEELLGFTTL